MRKFILLMLTLFGVGILALESCGPVVISTRAHVPTPPWLYPNRVEMVRYIYFPEHTFYYDLSLRNYIYLDNGIWVTATILPARYKNINLRRSRHVRINNYFGDNIKRYHKENNASIKRRSSTSRRKN